MTDHPPGPSLGRPAGPPRSVRADQLTGADIGSCVLILNTDPASDSEPRCIAGTLSDVETQRVGARVAHVAVHDDGELCTGATTVRTRRVVIFAGGRQLLLDPGQRLLVAG